MDKLGEYRKKRNFIRTGEPRGEDGHKSDRPRFVIQKHAASTLHYDFRLEIDGILKSWVIPKGPSTDPSEKRLAIQTEDHPLEYADFEGTIPEEDYGGGTVIVWDGGTYRNIRGEKKKHVSMQDSVDGGMVEVWLEGRKLKGGFVLIRTGKEKEHRNWLIKKMKDGEADARRNPVNTEPESILSNMTIEEVKSKQGM